MGSRTISKKYNLGVSPATVRNEMADLEEMGLIEQPHTSAGRIPSQIGYRYYVDYLMERQTVTNEVKKYIRTSLTSQIQGPGKTGAESGEAFIPDHQLYGYADCAGFIVKMS